MKISANRRAGFGGRYWARTNDLHDVNDCTPLKYPYNSAKASAEIGLFCLVVRKSAQVIMRKLRGSHAP